MMPVLCFGQTAEEYFKNNDVIKNHIITLIYLLFTFSVFSQSISEPIEFYDNGQAMKIRFLNDDLKLVKYQYKGADGGVIAEFQYDPETGIKNGDFFDASNKGSYDMGVLSATNFIVNDNTEMYVIDKVVNGKIIGNMKCYTRQEIYTHQYDANTSKLLSYAHKFNMNFYQSVGTGIYKEKYKCTLHYNENGQLDGKQKLNSYYTLYYDDGKLMGYTKKNKTSNISMDSIFRETKLWKYNNRFFKNCGYAWLKVLEEFDEPWEYKIEANTPNRQYAVQFFGSTKVQPAAGPENYPYRWTNSPRERTSKRITGTSGGLRYRFEKRNVLNKHGIYVLDNIQPEKSRFFRDIMKNKYGYLETSKIKLWENTEQLNTLSAKEYPIKYIAHPELGFKENEFLHYENRANLRNPYYIEKSKIEFYKKNNIPYRKYEIDLVSLSPKDSYTTWGSIYKKKVAVNSYYNIRQIYNDIIDYSSPMTECLWLDPVKKTYVDVVNLYPIYSQIQVQAEREAQVQAEREAQVQAEREAQVQAEREAQVQAERKFSVYAQNIEAQVQAEKREAQVQANIGFARIKGMRIYNFLKEIEWANRVPGDWVVGFYGDEDVFQQLSWFSGKFIGNDKIKVVRYNSLYEITKDCHFLYVSENKSSQLASIHKKIGDRTIVIGNKIGMLSSGAIINFIIKSNKSTYQINQLAADKLGVKFSQLHIALAD